jgi:hypothetical protein
MQESTIAELQSQVKALTARLDEQAAQIQKVSASAQLSEEAPRDVAKGISPAQAHSF